MSSTLEEDLLDTHLCLSCQCRMIGLDNYIRHKQVECPVLKNRRMTFSQIDHYVSESYKSQNNLTSTNFELKTADSLVLSYPTFQNVAVEEPECNLLDRIGVKHSSEQVPNMSTREASISDDESAVDCFFESLELRSRYGQTQPSKDCYSRLFEHQTMQATDDSSICSHQKLTYVDNRSILAVDDGIQNNPATSFGDCYPSATALRLDTTGSEMFSCSDNEDILHFAVSDLNTNESIQCDKDKTLLKQKPILGVHQTEARRGRPKSSLPGKWRPGERPVLRYHKFISRGKWRLTDDESADDQDGSNNRYDKSITSRDDSASNYGNVNNQLTGKVNAKGNATVQSDLRREKPCAANQTQYHANMNNQLPEITSNAFKCSTCNIEYRSKYSYARHLRTNLHLRRTKGFCQPSTSGSSEELLPPKECLVQTLMLRSKPFQCRVCRFFVDKKAEFVQHARSDEHIRATMEISLLCVRCQYVSNQAADLLTHLTTVDHDVSVLSSSARVNGCILRKHHQKSSIPKSRPRVVLCEDCPAKFKSESSLVIHKRRRHTHEKPFTCLACFRSFCDNSSLNTHKKSNRHRQQLVKLALFDDLIAKASAE